MDTSQATQTIRIRRARLYDAVFLMVVAALVLLVTAPALVPLVEAWRSSECEPAAPIARKAAK